MNKLTKIWEFLNGKKTIIGIAGHAIWLTTNLIFKDLTTSEESVWGHIIIGNITGVGLGHKALKYVNGIQK